MLRYPTRGSAPPVSAALVIALILALAAPAATQNFDLETLGTAPEVDTSALLEVLHKKWKGSNPGKNADDIPALAKMPSNLFGVAVVTVDGKVFTAGDVDQPFSIQSISTAFTLAKAVKENGSSVIEEMIGVNATDQTFDSIAAVEQSKGRAMNPFVTPGAIATTALVKGATADEVWGKIIGIHSDFAGRPLKVNEEVYKSASENNRRNQEMAKLMHDHGRIKGESVAGRRSLHPAVLDRDHHPRPGRHGRDARERRTESDDEEGSRRARGGRAGPRGDGHRRVERRLRQADVPRRFARQERR